MLETAWPKCIRLSKCSRWTRSEADWLYYSRRCGDQGSEDPPKGSLSLEILPKFLSRGELLKITGIMHLSPIVSLGFSHVF
jgi:hypothetical protein